MLMLFFALLCYAALAAKLRHMQRSAFYSVHKFTYVKKKCVIIKMESFIVHFNKVGPTSGTKPPCEMKTTCLRSAYSHQHSFPFCQKCSTINHTWNYTKFCKHLIKSNEIRFFLMFSTHCQLILVLKCHRVAASERMITLE